MKILGNELDLNELERIWPTEKGLLIVSAVLFVSGFSFGNIFPIDSENRLLISLCASELLVAVGYLFWLLSRKFPKVEKDKVGIIIAIRDNTAEAEKIKKDVIDRFKEITENLPIGNNICVLPVNDFISKQVINAETSDKVLSKCGGHFIIFGRTLNYKVRDNDQYEFNLTFRVRHRPLDVKEQSVLLQHFQESVLNKQWQFLEESPFTIIKVTADNIREIALYIIGIASFFSFDFDTSLRFHETLYSLLKTDKQKRSDLDVIYQRLEAYIADARMLTGIRNHNENPNDRPTQEKALSINEKALNLVPNHYPALVNKAKYLFQLGDIGGAKEIIKRIKRMNGKHPNLVRDSSWRYSEGFLLFYEGKFERGRSVYKKAISGYVTDFTLNGVIAFLTDYLIKNPSAIQYHYVLGMIYYYKLANITMALKEFQNFLDKTEGKQEYDIFRQEVQGYKLAIEKEIDQTNESK